MYINFTLLINILFPVLLFICFTLNINFIISLFFVSIVTAIYFIILILTLLFINGCASESGITSGVKRTPGGETVQLRETDNLTEAEKNKLRQNLIKEVREGFTF